MLRITLLSGEEVASLPLAELSDVKALKERLHQEHGLPPRFRQRLLHDGNPLDDAIKLESAMDLQVLIVAFCEDSEDQREELDMAAANGEVDKAEALLQLPMDPDTDAPPNEDGTTTLMCASQCGQVEIAQLLLEAGASPDKRDNFGETALMIAAQSGHSQVMQLLLDAGAQKDLRNDHGQTALIMAANCDRNTARDGNVSAVRLLLQAGADVDACDYVADRGCFCGRSTALIYAATNGHAEIVRLLLEAGAQTNARDSRGSTALIYSAISGYAPVAKLLLEAGAEKDLCDNYGNTALIFSAINGHTTVARLLEPGAQKDLPAPRRICVAYAAALMMATHRSAAIWRPLDSGCELKSGAAQAPLGSLPRSCGETLEEVFPSPTSSAGAGASLWTRPELLG
eukprot:s2440_g9.t1